MDSRGDSGDHSDALSGVQCGTVLPAAHWYIDSMQFTFARSALVVAWIALVSGVGLVTGAASSSIGSRSPAWPSSLLFSPAR